MTHDPLRVMDVVRERMGYAPVNPFVITGSDNPDPEPARTPEPREAPMQEFNDDEPASPLVPETFRRPEPPAVPVPGPVLPDLVVLDGNARLLGTDVGLEAEDVTAIKTIVLRAARRRIDSALTNLEKPVAPSPTVGHEGTPEVAAPRRRGRPKGSKNKIKTPKVADA